MVIEVDANSALIMDRGLPVGNSEDVFLRRALHVKIGNKPSEAIPTYSVETPGDEKIFSNRIPTVPGIETIIIPATVPLGKTWYLSRIEISCRQDSVFNFYINAGLVGAKRTGPGQSNDNFIFSPKLPISPGDTIELKVLAASYTPVTDSDATLMLIEQ